MKFCKDCKYHTPHHYCHHVSALTEVSLVSGKKLYLSAHEARGYTRACGPTGRCFERKPPRRERLLDWLWNLSWKLSQDVKEL